MWIATQDITGQVIYVWLQEEQTELRRRTHVGVAAGEIKAHGDYEAIYV